MKRKKLLTFVLTIVMVLGSFSMAFAQTTVQETVFADMPDNWSTMSLTKAVNNGLLMGYEVNGSNLIKPTNSLTRAEMAAVVNRAFGSTKSTQLDGVLDVPTTAWYAKDMSMAVQMQTFVKDTFMRPNDKITRQEAFAVLARAFKLTSSDLDYKALAKFSDKADIATWAMKDLNGMAEAGYINGYGGKLFPKDNITRAEFAVVMDNLVSQYIDQPGTVTEVVASGNVMIRTAGVTLKNVTIKGDLIIGDGVGEGDATLDSVKVEGRIVVRGGGVDSFIIKGNSSVGTVIVSKVDGEVRISVEGNADVEVIFVDDGSDDVIVQGTIGSLEVSGDSVTVTATGATVTNAVISGSNSTIVVGQGSTVNSITVKGTNATISGQGQVNTVDIQTGGNNANITTPNTVTKVAANVEGVTAGGQDVPAGSTATNNSTGTGATVVDTPVSEGGGGGGGGGGVLTPAMSIAEVTVDGSTITPVSGLYTIPSTATKHNTAIDVTITNTSDVTYAVDFLIEHNSTTVAEANAVGIEKAYIDALNIFGDVTFSNFATMFDRLGTSRSGSYLNAVGIEVSGSDVSYFTDAIDAMFARMGDGDTYTVTITLTPTGGTAYSLPFEITKQFPI